MNGQKLNIAVAFIAGLFSFFSPCVLPLAPGYISIISGVRFDDLQKKKDNFRVILTATVHFVLGFSIIFILMGSAVTVLGSYLTANRAWFSRISGALVVLFGLHMSGILPVAVFYRQAKLNINFKGRGYLRSFLTGVAFAIGWTPCVGPILGSILIIAGNSAQIWEGLFLLSAYAMGLAVPFFVLAIGLGFGVSLFKNWGRVSAIVEKAAGVLLILLGLLIFLGRLNEISFFFLNIGK